MQVINIRQAPEYAGQAIQYLTGTQKLLARKKMQNVYTDCILSALQADSPLPQWYLLEEEERIIGCAGLVPNDFISRMDLSPWVCALYVDRRRRGENLGRLLVEQAERDARKAGFTHLYLASELSGYHEKYGYCNIGTGYHPCGKSSEIYEKPLKHL